MSEEKEKVEVTASQLHDCYEEVCALRVKHEAAKKAASDIYEDLNCVKQKMIYLLREGEFDEFKGRDGNKVKIKIKKSAKMPLDWGAREELFEYLKEKGDFDGLISIHAAKFNSYYNQELEQAISKDPEAAMMWSMPGVEPPTEYIDLTIPTVRKIQGANKND